MRHGNESPANLVTEGGIASRAKALGFLIVLTNLHFRLGDPNSCRLAPFERGPARTIDLDRITLALSVGSPKLCPFTGRSSTLIFAWGMETQAWSKMTHLQIPQQMTLMWFSSKTSKIRGCPVLGSFFFFSKEDAAVLGAA